jgi:acyl-CoA synthetase (AMP-forming)/AMP-acid ligase II
MRAWWWRVLEQLLAACDRHPDAPALADLSYAQLKQRVLGTAAGLIERGFEPGDRVLFSVRPRVDGICLALGIVAAGGVVVFADPGAGEAMFRARAGLAAPRWVAAESLLYLASTGPLRPIARSRGLELPSYATVVPDARHVFAGMRLPGVPSGAVSIARLTGSTTPRGSEQDAALIIFTSGTTANPKAVVHSRASLAHGLGGFAAHVRFAPGQRVLTDQLMVGLPALIAGAHWLLPAAGADPGARPQRYLRLLPSADALFAVPAALDAMLTLLDREPGRAPALQTLLIGGAPVLRPLLTRARRRFPDARILSIYGMTEILPVAIADADEKLAYTGAGDYVGELLVDARIDGDELVVSGDGLALSYLGQPPLTELRTGDLARIDGTRLVLAGRSKDMFIRGTTNVYPGLYEPIIASLPGVTAAAMVGVPNGIGDDAIVLALVVDSPTRLPAIRRALPGLIDAAVLPDRIVLVDELPTTGRSSKLDRPALVRLVGQQ